MVEEVCGGGLRRREATPAGAGITGVISGSRYAVAIMKRDQPKDGGNRGVSTKCKAVRFDFFDFFLEVGKQRLDTLTDIEKVEEAYRYTA